MALDPATQAALDRTTPMTLEIDLHWQEMSYLEKHAAAAGQSVAVYLDGLLHDAILFESLEKAKSSPAKPFTPDDFQRLRDRIDQVAAERSEAKG